MGNRYVSDRMRGHAVAVLVGAALVARYAGAGGTPVGTVIVEP